MQEQSTTFVLTKMPNKRGKYNPTAIIPGLSEIYDKETGVSRICCYIPGQTTIWADEIKNFEEVKKNIKSIVITNGVKMVHKRENLLFQYMRNTGFNLENREKNSTRTTLFKELNREVDAKKDFLQKKERDNAIYFVNNESVQDVRSYALAISKNESEYRMIEKMSEYELRLAMRNVAEKDPKKFLESMKEVFIQNKVIIIKAIYADVIKVNKEQTSLSWNDGGEFIKSPQGMNVVDYFAKSNSPSHKKSFESMVEFLKDPSKEKSVIINEDQSLLEKEIEKVIDIALSKEIITCSDKNMWYTYNDIKHQTRKRFVEELIKNEKLFSEIKDAIQ